ncbi:MAG: transposase [Phycisphaerae bacterium]
MSDEQEGVRRRFTAQEKVAVLREHLVEKVPVSAVCDKHGLNPTVFYRWQKTGRSRPSWPTTISIPWTAIAC